MIKYIVISNFVLLALFMLYVVLHLNKWEKGVIGNLNDWSSGMKGTIKDFCSAIAETLKLFEKQMDNNKLSVKQYVKHKVASPQQIAKFKKKTEGKK